MEPTIDNQIEGKLEATPTHAELFSKKIWRVKDVQAFTGLGYSTLMRYTSQKRIPHCKRANRLYFIPQDIMNWIEEGD
ncbi:MAG: helix-turn-helix domain-containing protein [Bacteriovoracaceae bacterium]